jgi:hypothetical protein
MFTGANRNFFGVFIFLKTMLNLSLTIPQYQPETPPAWLSHLMDSKIANRMKAPKYQKSNFAQFWKQTDDQEKVRLAHNEKPLEGKARAKR